jgi:pectin-derived oligosaccharide transport system permease protein
MSSTPYSLRQHRPFLLFRGNAPTNRFYQALLRHIVAICLLVVMLYPLLWMAVASFHPGELALTGIGLDFHNLTLENYGQGLLGLHFGRYFLNSVAVALIEIVGSLLSCTLAAYAFARLEFRLKRVLFAILIGTLLLPSQVLIVPIYIIFNKLGLVGTYVPLILPHFVGIDVFFIFLNVQFIRTLPRELDAAARVDGAGELRLFLQIILPLCMPAVATTAMFEFINSWNDLLGPLLFLSRTQTFTVPLGLTMFVDTTGASSFGGLFAMSTLSLVPVAAFFFAAQRLLVEGITMTGFK